jgi:hypothetical protein
VSPGAAPATGKGGSPFDAWKHSHASVEAAAAVVRWIPWGSFPLCYPGLGSGLLGSFVWYRPGLCQCRFRIGLNACMGLNRPFFSGPKPDLLPAKEFYCRPRPAAQLLPISPGWGAARSAVEQLLPRLTPRAFSRCQLATL